MAGWNPTMFQMLLAWLLVSDHHVRHAKRLVELFFPTMHF